MNNVINFSGRLARKNEEKQTADLMAFFTENLMPHMSRAEMIELMDALERGDEAKYLSITEPIIRRQCIAEVAR